MNRVIRLVLSRTTVPTRPLAGRAGEVWGFMWAPRGRRVIVSAMALEFSLSGNVSRRVVHLLYFDLGLAGVSGIHFRELVAGVHRCPNMGVD